MLQNLQTDMLQNVTQQDMRIPQIVESELQGKDYSDIASDLGVSRMQIWRDRQTDIYRVLVEELFTTYKDKLQEFMNSGDKYKEIEGVKELGRAYRAGMTKHIRTDIDTRIDITIQNERRRLVESVIREVSPGDYRVLEDIASRVEASEE